MARPKLNIFMDKDYLHYFVCKDNLLTEDELQKTIEMCDKLILRNAGVMSSDGTVYRGTNIRSSKNSFIRENEETTWLFEKCRNIVNKINEETFGYDLSYGFDYFQYAEYNENDQFNFHLDTMLGKNSKIDKPRKLSISLILSDNSEYEGGDFQFYMGGTGVDTIEQAKGRFILFPSFLVHRVTPIKSGVRKSLVFWMQGPKFR